MSRWPPTFGRIFACPGWRSYSCSTLFIYFPRCSVLIFNGTPFFSHGTPFRSRRASRRNVNSRHCSRMPCLLLALTYARGIGTPCSLISVLRAQQIYVRGRGPKGEGGWHLSYVLLVALSSHPMHSPFFAHPILAFLSIATKAWTGQ